MSAVLDPSTTLPQAGALELVPGRDNAVMPGFSSEGSWKLANRIGQAFAASTIVPEAYRGNVANCIVALEMANRIGASPMMVMQNLYIVHGNPGWSSKFLIACFNQCGRYSALRYEWSGERGKKSHGCRAWAIEKATGEKLIGATVTVEMADAEGWSDKKGSKWKTMPEQMLMYRSAAFFVRTYAPEISMGLRTDDEMYDIGDEGRPAAGTGLGAVRAALDLGTVDSSTGEITPTAKADPAATPKARTYAELADLIQNAADKATAALLLDEGKSSVAPEFVDELVAVFDRRWA